MASHVLVCSYASSFAFSGLGSLPASRGRGTKGSGLGLLLQLRPLGKFSTFLGEQDLRVTMVSLDCSAGYAYAHVSPCLALILVVNLRNGG